MKTLATTFKNHSTSPKIPMAPSTPLHKRGQSSISVASQNSPMIKLEEYDHLIDGGFLTDFLHPYLKDLYKDLSLRSLTSAAIKEKQLDRFAFLEYCNLPGIINQRLLRLLDAERTDLIEQATFIRVLSKIFASDLDTRMRLTFQMYDVNDDGLVGREDIRVIMSYMPFKRSKKGYYANQSAPVKLNGKTSNLENTQARSLWSAKEGLYSEEEGKGLEMSDRIKDQSEIKLLIDKVFEGIGSQGQLTYDDYSKFNLSQSSEMFFSLMSLFHQNLPCSHNCFRLKHLYRSRALARKHGSFISNSSTQSKTCPASPIKHIASPSTMSCFNIIRCKPEEGEASFSAKCGSSKNYQKSIEATPTTNSGDTHFTKSNSNNSSQEEEIQPFELAASPQKRDSMKQTSAFGFQQAVMRARIRDFDENSLIVQSGSDTGDYNTISGPMKASDLTSVPSSAFMKKRIQKQTAVLSPQKLSSNLGKIDYGFILPQVPTPQSCLGTSATFTSTSHNTLHRRGLSTINTALQSHLQAASLGKENANPIDNFSQASKKDLRLYQGECFLKTKNDRYKKHVMVVEGCEVFWYKSVNDLVPQIMHSLVGTFAKLLPEEAASDLGNQTVWPVKIILPPNKSRFIYFESQDEQKLCLEKLNLANGFVDFFHYYQLDFTLGKGQFGQVRLAYHSRTGLKTAVKCIRKREMKPIEVYQQRKEIEVLKMSQHPNIVKMVDLFENVDHYFIVLEYMDGKDMFDYLRYRQFRITEARARDIMVQIIDAVKYLHSYGIIHRDIKLENIMMSDNSDKASPNLVDFGLAKILGPTETTTEPFGTLGYVAPEVLNKQPYSFSCDLWSLGCVCYALLSGSLPFDHASQQETIKQTLNSPLIFDLPSWKVVSENGKDFITQLLKKDPKQRMTIDKALVHPWLRDHVKK